MAKPHTKDGGTGRKVREERTVCTAGGGGREGKGRGPVPVATRVFHLPPAVNDSLYRSRSFDMSFANGSRALMQPVRGMRPHGSDYYVETE